MYEIIIVALGVFAGNFLGTVIGFAGHFIAIPIILLVLPFKETLAILTVFFFIWGLIMIFVVRHDIDKKVVKDLAVGAIIGSIIGVYLLQISNPILLKKLFGVLILLYIGYTQIKKQKIAFFSKFGVLFGFIGGIMSSLFTSGGPIFITYIDSKIDDIRVVRATVIGILAVTNILRFALFYNSNLFTPKIVSLSLLMLPFFLLSLYLGQKSYNRINKDILEKLVLIFFFISGVSLIL